MQYWGKRFSKSTQARFSLFVILCLSLFTACGAKKMAGGYVGEAKAELKPGNSYGSTDNLTDSNSDVLAVLTQDGETVKLRFGNTALLSKCELEAKITRGTAYIIDGTVCDISVAGMSKTISVVDGSISVGDYGDAEIIINVY